MITLLLAEDEYYTRKGLLKHLDFSSIGIDRVLEAEDGKQGIDLVRKELVAGRTIDILLTDVRMPHMDGIELAHSVRILCPDCVILFLSGYSDKEYLRSALSLRTFHYIDKPVDIPVLTDILKEAAELSRKLTLSDTQNTEELGKSAARDLAHGSPLSEAALQQLGLTRDSFTHCRTLLIQLLNTRFLESFDTDFAPDVYELRAEIITFFEKTGIPVLCSEFHEHYLLVQLLSSPEDSGSRISDASLMPLLNNLTEQISATPCFLSVGDTAHSQEELLSSYENAVIRLQYCFYLGIGSVSGLSAVLPKSYDPDSSILHAFQQAVVNRDEKQCTDLLEDLYRSYRSHPATLISNTRAFYRRMLYWLFQYDSSKHTDVSWQNETLLMDRIASSPTLDALHEFSLEYVHLTFEDPMLSGSREDNVAVRIDELIRENLSDPDLGLQWLSSRLNLSTSHLSFLYKQSGGETINQHIQEQRTALARKLLSETDLRVLDVARRCGYTDANYFAKMFRRNTGYLPTEYREIFSSPGVFPPSGSHGSSL